jgi:hypothetical protein
MKTTKNNRSAAQRTTDFRLPALLTLLICGCFSSQASLSIDSNVAALQSLQNLQQLSTGLQINSPADNAANPYTWIQAAPNVFSLNYNPQNQQLQSVLQLFRGDDSSQSQSLLSQANQPLQQQTALSTLQVANQQPAQQSLLQLFSGNAQSSVQTLQQANVAQQQVLQLIGQNDNASQLMTLQQASSSLSLSLANQSLQTSQSLLSQANPVESAVELAQGNQLNQLSTGLKINQNIDPSQLTVSTINGTVVQLSQQNDGYNNTLGLNADGLSLNTLSAQALLVDPVGQPTFQSSLTPNDFLTVGQLTQKEALSFFQMAEAVSGNSLQSLSSLNGNGLGVGDQFSTSVVVLKNLNSPYLFLSIADQSGLDAQDYNSAVLAVNISQANVQALTALMATPEPSMYLTLGGFLALAIWAKRRTDRLAAVRIQ